MALLSISLYGYSLAAAVGASASAAVCGSPAATQGHAAFAPWNIAYTKKVSEAEMAIARRWAAQRLERLGAEPPFSFVYGGERSEELLKTWRRTLTEGKSVGQVIGRTLTYLDPKTGLKVVHQAGIYTDLPAVEWVLYIENTGSQDTPILSDLQAADVTFSRGERGGFVLHHSEGSSARPTDFRPQTTELDPGKTLRLAPLGGRSSNHVMPYFNVAAPNRTGIILAVGWSGEWAASFARDEAKRLRVRAGMDRTHLTLRPGERIRTPSIVMLFYRGDPMRGQNLWRNFMLHHATPAPGGRPVDPPVAASGATIGFNNMTLANQIQAVTNVARHRLPVDTYWVDAGWSTGGFPKGMGTIDPDPVRFAGGLRPLADTVHKAGLRFLLWFEPERVMPGTWLRRQHPEWLLTPATSLPVAYDGKARLLNLGDPRARTWLTDTISGLISDWGIDVYRHDCNIQPLFYWRTADPPNRRGMTEIRYIEGLYAFFDALRYAHPGVLVDNCASGGRRLDLEMMRRSLPLWRSDYCWEPVGQQCMTYGLSFWFPLHGVGAVACDAYNFRSGMGANTSFAFNYYSADATFWTELKRRIEVYLKIRELFAGDFYPLTPYSTAETAWMAWQYDRPDLGAGLIQAFRRAESPNQSVRLRLRGLLPRVRYRVLDQDAGEMTIAAGSELMGSGLPVAAVARPTALVITYRQIQD